MGVQNNNAYQQPTTLNGIDNPEEEKDKIRNALQIMSKHTKSLGDDLMKLATMSEQDPNQFQLLLTMLRK
jgi:ferritin